jgi:hypothetical protein
MMMAALVVWSLLHPGKVCGYMPYDCANTTSRVDIYSLLEPAACPSAVPHHAVERTIFGEIYGQTARRT